MNRLNDKAAIVTGAASGIGRVSAMALAQAGARVAVADIDAAGAETVAAEIVAAGGDARAVTVDLSQEDSVRAMVEAAVGAFGTVDILHNNAALTAPDVISRDMDIVNMDTAIWDRVMAVNLRGAMLGCKHALPHMLKRGAGAIINTSSVSGLAGDLALPAYGASKAGLNLLTQYVATQYGKQGVRCNAIAPGVIETPALARKISDEQRERYLAHHLTPRLGRPEDIAHTVVFLASDEAAYITGQIIAVDGGLMSHHPAVADFRE